MRNRYDTGGLAALDAPADDDTPETLDPDADEQPSGAVTSAGGLTALDIPGAAEALALMAKSSEEARKALQQARTSILARKYNRAIPLLAASAALGAPTRAGSTAESFGAMSGALLGPLREKQAFETGNQKELLGVDSSLAGLDERSAQAQLQLAMLRAKMGNDPLEKVMVPGHTNPVGMTRRDARNKELWVPTPANTNVNLNTNKSLYGGMADKLSEEYTNQYKTALKAPVALERTDQVRQLLSTQPYTGTAAEWKLKIGKAAKAIGFDYAGSDIKNTELLFSRLGHETLDNIHASGLGSGNGFTDKDLEFLRQVVGGTISLDNTTLSRLADLHENSARQSVAMWNSTFSRLKPDQMKELGLTQITLPPARRRADPTAGRPRARPAAPLSPPPPGPGVDEQTGNPDDYAPAQAPPAALEILRQHPETAAKFKETFGYLPDGF